MEMGGKLVGLEFDAQAEACIDLLRAMIGARWATHFRMLGANNATRYMLLHLTNHDVGRFAKKNNPELSVVDES